MNNFAIFKYPNEENTYFIGANKLVELDEVNLKSIKGFLIKPFNIHKKACFITPEKVIKNPDINFLNNLHFHTLDYEHITTSKLEYIKYVESSILAIKNNKFKKIVCARTKLIQQTVNPIVVFKNACTKYPNAFISLISTPNTGTWVGATPEVLLTIDNQEILQTVALAGTQKKGKKTPSEAVWTQKEIEEQALVSRYIINCFKQIRLREFEEDGPKTIIAGDLMHLKTSFKVNLNDVQYEDLGSTLLQLLHPTSAVAGMPKEDALHFIDSFEKFNRELYAGFIGPVNFNDKTSLFVNLRCSKINKDSVLLYAGAGITEDSNANNEWAETEHKCMIINSLF